MNAIARISATPLAARLADFMMDWRERRDERRALRNFDESLSRDLDLIRTDIRRGYRRMRFTRSWQMM